MISLIYSGQFRSGVEAVFVAAFFLYRVRRPYGTRVLESINVMNCLPGVDIVAHETPSE